MGGSWGSNIRLSIFGESHGAAIGIIIDGLAPGLKIDLDYIKGEMLRRAPGRSEFSSPRAEEDQPEILSGVLNGITTGAPLCCLIKNEDGKPSDYNSLIPRPGHADLAAYYKYNNFADLRGGGHFSGRLTAPLVFAGAIAKQVLREKGVEVWGRILSIAGVKDDPVDIRTFAALANKSFSAGNKAEDMQQAIIAAKNNGDSVGGVIECIAVGAPRSLGSPFFESAESVISGLMFSIPAVKGVEFGDGFAMAERRGSEVNDQLRIEKGQVAFMSNHNGGINGGITNGEPLLVRVAIKPTPTIAKEQMSVDLSKMENVVLKSKGRHDPCIVPRAVPVVEAALALSLLDLMQL